MGTKKSKKNEKRSEIFDPYEMLSQLKLKQIYDFLFTYFEAKVRFENFQEENRFFSLFWMYPNLIPIPDIQQHKF